MLQPAQGGHRLLNTHSVLGEMWIEWEYLMDPELTDIRREKVLQYVPLPCPGRGFPHCVQATHPATRCLRVR